MSARLDVVIPVRNVDAYLGEALDSALDQRAEVAIVVVDAGSTTPIRLAERHSRRPEVRLLRSESAMLAGSARSIGVAEGVSPWVSFLDADDIWPAGSREAMLAAAEAASADVVVGQMEHFHADADAAAKLKLPVGRQRALIAGGIVFRRSVWEEVGAFDPTLRAGEFVEWFNRVTIAGKRVLEVPDLALRRRVHVASTTATQARTDDRDDYLKVVRRWMHRND